MTDLRTQQFWRAQELLDADLPELRYAVEGIVPEGLVLLVGAPKAGKSWAALCLSLAVASGGRALGQIRCEAGDVLYCALEDGPRRLRDRLRKLLDGHPAPDRLSFVTRAPRIDEDLSGFLARWIGSVESPRLIVVDVLARVRPPGDGRGSLYDADYQALEGLQRLANEHGIALLIVHHTRKQKDDDFLVTVSGTFGLSGAADAVLVLARSRTAADAVLAVTGRDIAEAEFALTFDSLTGSWRLLGDARKYATTPERRSVLDLLDEHGALTPKRLAELSEISHDNAKQILRRMASSGEVDTDGSGTYLPLTLSPLSPVSLNGDSSDTGDRGTGVRHD